MDPVSHVLFGRALIALDGRRRLGPHAAAACMLGALAPDVDALMIFRGWDVYLRMHQVGTHSVLGALAVGLGAAGLVAAAARRARHTALIFAAWLGALSHVAFDLFSGAVLKPGWPVFDREAVVPLVAMADPWLVGICAAGGIAIWFRKERTTRQRTARHVLTAIACFLALKAVLMTSAVPRWTTARGPEPIISHSVEARWGSLTQWNVFDRTSHALREWRVNAFNDGTTLLLTVPLEPESKVVAASRSLDTVRNFLRVHQLGFAVTLPLDNGGTRVWWSDIRYCSSTIECGLWFGGTFGADGRAITQAVRVGDWTQTRAAGR